MAKGMSGVKYPNPFNETGSPDPNMPDTTGDALYFGGWPEIDKMHLSMEGADMISSSNSDASHGIFGGPNPGEPNPGGMSMNGGTKGSKGEK